MKFKETPQFFFFTAECSNCKIDLNGEVVSQAALLESKDFFLANGVISKDHKYKQTKNGRQIYDERYVIGEPVSVFKRGDSTWITGKLYKNNPLARIAIELLRRGSNKVKASIGGTCRRAVTVSTRKKVVISILWCEVSLTTTPANNTLQPVRGVIEKSIKLADIKIRKMQKNVRAVSSLEDIYGIVWPPKAKGRLSWVK